MKFDVDQFIFIRTCAPYDSSLVRFVVQIIWIVVIIFSTLGSMDPEG